MKAAEFDPAEQFRGRPQDIGVAIGALGALGARRSFRGPFLAGNGPRADDHGLRVADDAGLRITARQHRERLG